MEGSRSDELAEPLEVGLGLGPLLHQVVDPQLVALAARRADVDEAGDLFDVRNPILEGIMHLGEPAQEIVREDVVVLDRDEHVVVRAELLLERAVGDPDRMIRKHELLGIRRDLDEAGLGYE